MLDLTVSIVTMNNSKQLEGCLDSIYKSTTGLRIEVCVVDNNSTDDTREIITKKYSDVNLISNYKIMSFSYNHNLILKAAKGKTIVILNDDTIIKKDSFSKMFQYLNSHDEVGAIGPKMHNPDGSYQESAFKFPNLLDFSWHLFLHRLNLMQAPALYKGIKDKKEAKEVDWLLGACLLVPKNTIDKIGYFDETFKPVYTEDTDLCKRIRDAGNKIIYYPGAEIMHYGSQTIQKQKILTGKIFTRSRIYFFRKHYGVMYAACAKCILFFAAILNYILNIFRLKCKSSQS